MLFSKINMKKLLLLAVLPFIFASPVFAFTETWNGGSCEYANFLSRTCNQGALMYFADGNPVQCFIEFNSNSCVGNDGLDPNTVYFVKGNAFNKDLFYKDKAPNYPVKMIYRNSGNSPIAAFAHYENDVLIENDANNTPQKTSTPDQAIPQTQTTSQTVNNATGQSQTITIIKPTIESPVAKPLTNPQPSTTSVAQLTTNANTIEGLKSEIAAIIKMIALLQAELLAIQGK